MRGKTQNIEPLTFFNRGGIYLRRIPYFCKNLTTNKSLQNMILHLRAHEHNGHKACKSATFLIRAAILLCSLLPPVSSVRNTFELQYNYNS